MLADKQERRAEIRGGESQRSCGMYLSNRAFWWKKKKNIGKRKQSADSEFKCCNRIRTCQQFQCPTSGFLEGRERRWENTRFGGHFVIEFHQSATTTACLHPISLIRSTILAIKKCYLRMAAWLGISVFGKQTWIYHSNTFLSHLRNFAKP